MALLISLAALAEHAAVRSLPVRFIVLWLLRRAEEIAETFVFEATGIPPAIGGIDAGGNASEDALALAARLYALAAALGFLLSVVRRSDGRLHSSHVRRGFAFGRMAHGSGQLSCGRALQPNDTS